MCGKSETNHKFGTNRFVSIQELHILHPEWGSSKTSDYTALKDTGVGKYSPTISLCM